MAEKYNGFAEIKELISKLRDIDKKLLSLKQVQNTYKQKVKEKADALIHAQVEKKLKEMSVEELAAAKTGIRVSLLENAGIKTIAQLRQRNVSTLSSINGIGDASARKIVAARDALIKTVESNARIRFSPDDSKDVYADGLLKVLYQSRKIDEIKDEAKKLYDATHKDVQQLISESKPAGSRFSWFFSSKETREKSVAVSEGLSEYVNGSYNDEAQEIFKKSQAVLKARHDEYWDDFAKNAASYYASLETRETKLSPSEKSKRFSKGEDNSETNDSLQKAREDAIKNGLPVELAVAIEEIKPNLDGLKCTLRPYQYFGVQYILRQGAVLLGDEMGLGKTVQAIATMVSLSHSGATHFMVVCPASVLINWGREISKHSELSHIEIHGKDCTQEAEKWIKDGGVGVTTFETISKIELPEDFKVSIIVVDEAHYVKNPEANRTKALMKLRKNTDRALFMTGTALENRVEEMQFLISMLQPKIAEAIKGITSVTMAPDFREKVAPVYFRRTREDVLTELPDKIENELWCTMTNEESVTYSEAVMDSDFMRMRQVSWLDEPDVSSKCEQLLNLCSQAIESGRKVIVFSFFTNTIARAQSALCEKYDVFGPINGSISPEKRQEIIDEFSAHEGGAVLVSQIQAGGTGLNIQAASTIIFTEPQLKPSIENQAIARAYRMGQVNTVIVYRLLCSKSVDERIMNILKEKQKLFDNFADKSISGEESLKLSDEDFEKILEEEKKRVS